MNYALKFVSHSASKQTITMIFKVNINKAFLRTKTKISEVYQKGIVTKDSKKYPDENANNVCFDLYYR